MALAALHLAAVDTLALERVPRRCRRRRWRRRRRRRVGAIDVALRDGDVYSHGNGVHLFCTQRMLRLRRCLLMAARQRRRVLHAQHCASRRRRRRRRAGPLVWRSIGSTGLAHRQRDLLTLSKTAHRKRELARCLYFMVVRGDAAGRGHLAIRCLLHIHSIRIGNAACDKVSKFKIE